MFCDGHSLFRLFVSFFLRMFTSPDVPSLTSSWVTDQHVDWRWISYSRWIRPVRMERWRHGQLLNSSGVTRNLQLYATSSGLRSNYCKLWWHWSYFSRFFFSFDQCFLCSFKMAPPARKMNDRFTNSVRVFSVNVWPHRLFFLFFSFFFLIGINVQLAESTGWKFLTDTTRELVEKSEIVVLNQLVRYGFIVLVWVKFIRQLVKSLKVGFHNNWMLNTGHLLAAINDAESAGINCNNWKNYHGSGITGTT